MSELDTSKTVNNILSGREDVAQELAWKVIKNAADMANLPDVDVAKLPVDVAKLPGVGDVLKEGLSLGRTLDVSKRQTRKPVPKSQCQFSPFDSI